MPKNLETELKSGRIKKHGVRKRRTIVPRTMDALRDKGYVVAVVELPPMGLRRKRQDCFGIGDLLAIKRDEVLLVQVAGPGERLSHIRKIEDAEDLGVVREANIRIELWTWSKVKVVLANGKKGKAQRWRPVIDDLS